MDRAEALLGEAEELARRCQLELVDIPLGWGLVDYHRGRWPEARTRLRQALELSRRLGEPWWKAQCLEALGRLYLELDEPAELLSLAVELEELAPRLGEGSEAGFALALRGLAHSADEQIEAALAFLRKADARRLLAFVARRAAVSALRGGNAVLARDRAAIGLAAARAVHHADEAVLCRAVLSEALFQNGQLAAAREELLELRRDARRQPLGALAQQAIDRLRQRWGGER